MRSTVDLTPAQPPARCSGRLPAARGISCPPHQSSDFCRLHEECVARQTYTPKLVNMLNVAHMLSDQYALYGPFKKFA